MIPLHSIRWLIDRLHVGTPDADITADMERRTVGWPKERAPERAWAIRYALRAHHANQARYRRVTAGRLVPTSAAADRILRHEQGA
mgnify:CR=1 FL=1